MIDVAKSTQQIVEPRETGSATDDVHKKDGSRQLTGPRRLNELLGMFVASQLIILPTSPWSVVESADLPTEFTPHRTPDISRSLAFGASMFASIWDSPKMARLLQEPLGSPIDLTADEAEKILRLAFGRRPDLPASVEFVREVRELLGHSMMERMKDSDA